MIMFAVKFDMNCQSSYQLLEVSVILRDEPAMNQIVLLIFPRTDSVDALISTEAIILLCMFLLGTSGVM